MRIQKLFYLLLLITPLSFANDIKPFQLTIEKTDSSTDSDYDLLLRAGQNPQTNPLAGIKTVNCEGKLHSVVDLEESGDLSIWKKVDRYFVGTEGLEIEVSSKDADKKFWRTKYLGVQVANGYKVACRSKPANSKALHCFKNKVPNGAVFTEGFCDDMPLSAFNAPANEGAPSAGASSHGKKK